MIDFSEVREAVETARGITWDTCHKIYVLMDDEQIDKMTGYGYDPIFTYRDMTPREMYDTVLDWYRESCMLRFIDSVETNHQDPNAGFRDLVPQGVGEEDDDE